MKSGFKKNIPIICVLTLAAVLYTFNIWGEGFQNAYYAAGVYSMGQNFHAFFFNSLDSVGFVSIDKPPLGLWIQVLFTKVFGFSGWVLVLPEALSGVASVYLIYRMVEKRFSKTAGIAAALILTLTPIYAAVSRNNTIDGILILVLVLAANQALLAAEKSSTKHMIFAALLIGAGFNIKMLQAYMIVPAVYITYLVFSNQNFLKKLLVCVLSGAVLAAVSLSWILAVDLTDAQSRPYVGSSDTNSALELAIGYNGINRIFGRSGANISGSATQADNAQAANPNAALNSNAKSNAKSSSEAGETSILRLFNDNNAGQASWFLLPALILSVISLALVFVKKFRHDKRFAAYFLFSVWLVPMFIYFSFAQGLTHRYYFAMLGPPMAALCGIGLYYLLKSKDEILLPASFAICAAAQLYIQSLYAGWADWMLYLSMFVFVIAFCAVVFIILNKSKRTLVPYIMAVLCIMPFVWAASPAVYSDNSQLPIAGPELIEQNDKFDDSPDFSELISYLEKNRDGADYLVSAASSLSYGSELILQSGGAVMVLGGFNGSDEILSVEEFSLKVENGEVRYAFLPREMTSASNREIFIWIRNNGNVVAFKEYGGAIDGYILVELG